MRWSATLLVTTCTYLALFGRVSGTQAGQLYDMAVVVHPDTPVSNLTLAETREVFLGNRRYWKTGLPVTVFVRASPPGGPERDVVLQIIYQMTEAQYQRYWLHKIFMGEATSPPRLVVSNDQAQEFVSLVPGAIALVRLSDVEPGVKVLRVDGRLPGQPGYALRAEGL